MTRGSRNVGDITQAGSGHMTRWWFALGVVAALGALGAVTACSASDGRPLEGPPVQAGAPGAGEVHYILPTGPPRIPTDQVDQQGKPITLACSSCHSIKAPNTERRDGASLTAFHQGLKTQHGGLTCLSCHDSVNYDRLRLADMTPVPFKKVMTLCRQCHGPQVRDYNHGAHGGMQGFWDKRRGPRTRNGCLTCHDPHAPKFRPMYPAPGPIDRFAEPSQGPGHE